MQQNHMMVEILHLFWIFPWLIKYMEDKYMVLQTLDWSGLKKWKSALLLTDPQYCNLSR